MKSAQSMIGKQAADDAVRHVRLALLVYLFAGAQAMIGQQVPCPNTEGEPMAVDGNAPIVTLHFKRKNGTDRPARFLFDSGGGAIVLDRSLADDLELKPTGDQVTDEGVIYAPIRLPEVQIGSGSIALSTSKAFMTLGNESFDTRDRVEGLLPGKALEPYQVVIDYPRGRFTVAPEGCLQHRGVSVPSPFVPSSGHPEIEISLEGKKYGFLLDTGARATLARRELLESLLAAHPTWPHSIGASGTANMQQGGGGNELLLRIPDMNWGTFRLKNVLVVSRPNKIFSPDHFETPGPIVGSVAGNVLKNFRVEIDYPERITYLEQKKEDCGDDMNTVGLVLDVDGANNLVVRAISTTAAALTKKNIRPGDQILEIDGKHESPWKITEASNALSGAVGDIKRLVIKRNDSRIRTYAVIAHIL